MDNYRQRELAPAILRALKTMPVVVVTGMRQVGKTTLLREEKGFRSRRYVNLDEFGILEAAREDPAAFVASANPLTIDEAQHAPFLMRALKVAVDRSGGAGRFVLSGSANLLLLSQVTESLAGRAVYLELWPLTRRELAGAHGTRPFLVRLLEGEDVPALPAAAAVAPEEVLRGGMPRVALGEADAHTWFMGYEQTYVERDVRGLSMIKDLLEFRKFLRLCALRTGNLLNLSSLCRDVGVTFQTAARYLGLLEASFVLFRVPPFVSNPSSRLVKSPKIYVADSGLAGYFSGRRDPGPGDASWGALVETYVAQNLKGILSAWCPTATLCFWQIHGRHEVDFVVDAGERCVALEVKWGTRWSGRDVDGLRRFVEGTPNCAAALLACNVAEPMPLGPRIYAVPLGMVLS
jgi:predicted AAA+ superfamily ATPase